MAHDQRDPFCDGVSRRTFIKATGAGAVAVLGGSLYATAPAAARAQRVAKVDTPLRHVVISCSENRSFDHYFGYAQQVQDLGFGPPAGYSQPDAAGNPHFPFEFTALETPDPPHTWNAIHEQYNGGAMDGFYRSSQASIGDGDAAMGYYTATQLPFYYGLLDDSALVANFFCSLLGPTWPNRFYMAAATSGGITTNGIWGYGVFDYPIILDLLDAAGVTWKIYNVSWDSVPFGNTDNVFVFWKRYAHDNRTRGSKGAFRNDARKGRLPQVSWIIPSFARGWDEHPPADPTVGMGIQEDLITALRESPLWENSAYISNVRRARRLLRARGAAAARRVRARDPHSDLGDLAVREARPDRNEPAVRPRLDGQAARAAARATDARLAEPPLRRRHPHRPQLRGRRCARAAARRARGHRRHARLLRLLRLLEGRKPGSRSRFCRAQLPLSGGDDLAAPCPRWPDE